MSELLSNTKRYSLAEELANSITHGIGALLSIAGLVVLVRLAVSRGDVWHIVSSSIFGATLILLYLSSTLYHSITAPRAKEVLRRFDHIAIYLLIAGTYTPFLLVSLRGPWGWSVFALVWGIALTGILLKVSPLGQKRGLSLTLYLVLGWSILIVLKPLLGYLEPAGIRLLVAGGLAYTGGVIFYGWKRLPYNHAIWHLFVLAGSCLHFFAILFYVIPPNAT
ncbi:PAQR family membrane homeostasis protein TrhA [Pelovirga terrestris]|uniref:Hemolysin III family protein n=1 Tax=Pelovirga terrestris TaxID=2771352 RepID=A0A8J6UR72_9BACT|nr:hemolysin III family protein [Pelovirga terrestris]MBD1400696.1 hemolysin III family protein [Pelovirga terrestris]